MDRVLVVDDDPHFTHLIGFLISQKGYEVDIAHTKRQALNLIQKNAYSLILQDVFFPGKEEGLQLLYAYKSKVNTNFVPVVLTTSMPSRFFTEEENMDEYLKVSKEIISKLDDPKKIVSRIIEIIRDQSNPQ